MKQGSRNYHNFEDMMSENGIVRHLCDIKISVISFRKKVVDPASATVVCCLHLESNEVPRFIQRLAQTKRNFLPVQGYINPTTRSPA